MSAFAERAIIEAIRSETGGAPIIRRVDRTVRSPMNFALHQAEQEIRMQIPVYWVDGGAPGHFYLQLRSRPGADPVKVVAFSSRAVQVFAMLRQILMPNSG